MQRCDDLEMRTSGQPEKHVLTTISGILVVMFCGSTVDLLAKESREV